MTRLGIEPATSRSQSGRSTTEPLCGWDSRDEREGQVRKREMNESEETEGIKTFHLYPYLLQGQQALPNTKHLSVWMPRWHKTPLPHPTTPIQVIWDNVMNTNLFSIGGCQFQHSHLIQTVQNTHHDWRPSKLSLMLGTRLLCYNEVQKYFYFNNSE